MRLVWFFQWNIIFTICMEFFAVLMDNMFVKCAFDGGYCYASWNPSSKCYGKKLCSKKY